MAAVARRTSAIQEPTRWSPSVSAPTRLASYPITPEQQQTLHSGTNRFRCRHRRTGHGRHESVLLRWRVNDDPAALAEPAADAHRPGEPDAGGRIFSWRSRWRFTAAWCWRRRFIFFFIAAFVFPALRIKERKYIYRALFIGGGLFLVGVAFCYFILMPVALAASQMYSQWLGLWARCNGARRNTSASSANSCSAWGWALNCRW